VELAGMGWDEAAAKAFEAFAATPGVEPARVIIEFNHIYRVWTSDGELDATSSGRLKHQAASRSELPAVGDWVVIRRDVTKHRRPLSPSCPGAAVSRERWRAP
jgi:ribosome biogenesis GTPase